MAFLLATTMVGCGEDEPENDTFATSDTDTDAATDADAATDSDAEGDGFTNGPACPETHPYFTVQQSPVACGGVAEGEECHYAAMGCAPGTKPDMVCTCENGELRCPLVIANCLPVDEGWSGETDARPAPEHRATAEACEALPAADGVQCAATTTNNDECSVDADCPDADDRCLVTHEFGSSSYCGCQAPECFADDDCGAGKLCACGVVEGGPIPTGCDFGRTRCMHDCLPAECRVDADCGAGQFCSPVKQVCGSVVRYACHDPATDACLSDWECGGQGPYRGMCTIAAGETDWSCQEIPVCD